MGSTSVTYMTAPNAFRAAQQPLPTYKKRRKRLVELLECNDSFVYSHMCTVAEETFIFFTDLTISAHHHLFSPKHDVSGSFQPDRRVQQSQAVALYFTSGYDLFYVHSMVHYPSSMDSLQQ